MFSGAYQHWDFAGSHLRPGESWILNGLEPRPGEKRPGWDKPRDRLWQGVLVHVTRAGVAVCRPSIQRRRWFYTYNAGATYGPYPARVTARSGAIKKSWRRWMADFRWGDEDWTQYTVGWGPTPDRAGFIRRQVPKNY